MPLRFQPARGASVVISASSRGPTGAAATIAVGTTTTSAQGTSSSVANAGTSSAAVFNFTIPRGAVPAVGWNFDDATADADPGSGDFRLNHATPASATAAYFDNNERGGTAVTSFLDAMDDMGDATTRGILVLLSAATPTTFHIYRISGSVVDGTGYRKVTIASLGGAGTFTAGEHVAVQFMPAGPAATANSFETINCPAGTDPVAESSTDTLNLAAPAAGMTITGDSATDTITFALANDLAALEGMSSTGLVARTASETYAQRTLTAPAAGFTITDGNGVAGNPTFVLADDLAALEALSGTDTIYRRSASNTWSAVTFGSSITFSGGQISGTAASETQVGSIEVATAAETTTGTDATRAVSPDGLAGSDYGKAVVPILVFDDSENCATGDGAGDVFYRIPAVLNGYNLVAVAAHVQTAGTTNTMDIQIHNVTQAADMLTTKITIDSTEKDTLTAATPAVIDAANDDVATGDEIRIDVDAVHTTPAKGLLVELTFQLP